MASFNNSPLNLTEGDVNRLDFIDGENILTHDAAATSSEALKGTEIVGLYFSAHWCPPCRRFTPLLAKRYEELKQAGHSFEIVFVSSDQSEAAFAEYWEEMPWKALAYSQTATKESLSKVFGVNGIPALILLDGEGKLITTDGREAIMQCSFDKIGTYEVDKLAAAAKLDAIVAGLPETVTHACHEHPLTKQKDPYGPRGWGCDVCEEGGRGWAYRCVECGFDAHAKCVCDLPEEP
jgi:nucleoredoxin